MVFDPDAFLGKKKETTQKPSFDPDSFLATDDKEEEKGFDPDKFVGDEEPQPKKTLLADYTPDEIKELGLPLITPEEIEKASDNVNEDISYFKRLKTSTRKKVSI